MALPSLGAISLAQVNTELGFSSSANVSLDQAAVRSLFSKPSGIIAMSDGYGKSNAVYAKLSSINKSPNVALSNGNLTATFSGAGSVLGDILAPGSSTGSLWRYYEVTIVTKGTSQISIGQGRITANLTQAPGQVFNNQSDGMSSAGTAKVYPNFNGFATTPYGQTHVVAWAFSGGAVRLYVNAAYMGGMSSLQADSYPMIGVSSYTGPVVMTCNFGGSPWVYPSRGMGGWI